jgi:hypothetical protein
MNECTAYFERSLKKFKLGDIYLDVFFHPTLCLEIDINYERKDISLVGISLFDGSYPRSCSVIHSSPDKISHAEALRMKEEYERSRRPRCGIQITAMCYTNGTKVMEGDKVRIEDDDGIVEFLIDRDKMPAAFTEKIWQGHKKRALIRFSKRGFVHYIGEPDNKLMLISRKSRDTL